MREFFSEFTEGITNFDAKLWRTLPALMTRPGLLTAEFNAGRRTRYVHPLRVYLFVTFVFFGLLAAFGSGKQLVQLDASQSSQGTPLPEGFVDRLLLSSAAKLQKAGDKELANQFASHLPQVMFVVLPLAALLLMAAYGRRRFYVEHLVFVTHMHSFLFVLLALFVAVPVPVPVVQGIATLAALVYFVAALKRVYGEGMLRTIVKATFLSIAYCLVVMVGLFATEALVVAAL